VIGGVVAVVLIIVVVVLLRKRRRGHLSTAPAKIEFVTKDGRKVMQPGPQNHLFTLSSA
jgi:hypothetical protein